MSGYPQMMQLRLGSRRFDVTHRALVMGVLNRTTDSFFDRGAHFELDAFLLQAERLVAGGADLLDIGARAAGVGTRKISEAEETDLVCSSVEALQARFDLPLSVDTWNAGVAKAAFDAGVVVGNDMSGFRDPCYLPVAAAAGASVVATHIRLPPGVPDPQPRYREVVADVAGHLQQLAARACAAGIPQDRVMVDPGLDLGKTWEQSLLLLARSAVFAGLGHPLLVSPSNKIFLGRLLGLETHERGAATVAACTLAAARGARILRVHDARAARHAVDLVAAALEADEV